jgi:enoyl-CoA hydratase/carnithine racemase
MDSNTGDTGRTGIPSERVQLACLTPGPRHALLAAVRERHGAGSRGEAETDLSAGAEKCVHVLQNGRGLKQFLTARERHGETRHATRLGGLTDPGSLRNLLRPLAPSTLCGELRGAGADLTQVLLVRCHRGDGGALAGLQLGAEGIEPVVAQLTKGIGFDPVAERGKLHPCALYSAGGRASRRVRILLLYDACSHHRIEGGTAVGQVLHDAVRVEREGAVVTLTIDHPPANAVNGDVVNGLVEGLSNAEADESCRALVITGSGPKFFSAGADITGFGEGADAVGKATDLTLLFEASRLPVIAAINGIAFGGGCELTLACDVRIASRTARFGQPEIKLGIIPGWGGTQRLPRLIGAARATELLLTGDPIDAERALAIGLVAEVVEPDELPAAAQRWGQLLASRAPLALAATKRATRAGAQLPISDALQVERMEFVALFATEDAQEGIAAFMQKRPAEWKGR